MARTSRAEVFDPAEVSVFHCINRCVRRCFLCGVDPLTGVNYEHRKAWIQLRLESLAGFFGIDVLGFSIMENHFHVILRNRPDVVAQWSDEEVARRWLMLCPVRKRSDGTAEIPSQTELNAILNDVDRLAEIRTRLSHISWFMRMVAERVARQANAEDRTTGRFWQGRFRSVKLCDAAAVLACAVYVDLNPIRAHVCLTPEESPHTSVAIRWQQYRAAGSRAAEWLAPLTLSERASPGPQVSAQSVRCSDKGFLPVSLEDYLQLVDWTGRQVVAGKSGHIPERLAPILIRLGIDRRHWLPLSTRFSSLFYCVAGSRPTLAREAIRRRRRWYQAPGGQLLTATAA